jgi:hypothetical protein
MLLIYASQYYYNYDFPLIGEFAFNLLHSGMSKKVKEAKEFLEKHKSALETAQKKLAQGTTKKEQGAILDPRQLHKHIDDKIDVVDGKVSGKWEPLTFVERKAYNADKMIKNLFGGTKNQYLLNINQNPTKNITGSKASNRYFNKNPFALGSPGQGQRKEYTITKGKNKGKKIQIKSNTFFTQLYGKTSNANTRANLPLTERNAIAEQNLDRIAKKSTTPETKNFNLGQAIGTGKLKDNPSGRIPQEIPQTKTKTTNPISSPNINPNINNNVNVNITNKTKYPKPANKLDDISTQIAVGLGVTGATGAAGGGYLAFKRRRRKKNKNKQ